MNICLFENKTEICRNIIELSQETYTINKVFENGTDLSDYIIKGDHIDILICNLSLITPELEVHMVKIGYIIALVAEQSPEILLNALSVGARDILTMSVDQTILLNSLQKAILHINTCNQASGKKSAKVITFISSKGGIGKSVICTNLALLLQKNFRKNVLLIDTVQRFGSTEILLNFSDKKSMAIIPAEVDNSDNYWQDIQDNTLVHNSGLSLLLAGDDNGEQLSPLKIKSILNTVKDKYDYVFIDTDNYFVEPMLSLLELSDQIIYLSKMDIASLKNLRMGLDSLKSFYFSLDKIKLVINCFEKTSELSTGELEKFLNWKIFSILPEDRATIISSINKGIPFVIDKTDSELFKSMKQFAERILGIEKAHNKEADATGKENKWFQTLVKLLK